MYSVYYPCHSYDQTLDVLSTTKTNSKQTSSLPLADFWHPDRNKVAKKQLFSRLGIKQNPQLADYCFEYPTPAYKDGKSGKSIPYSKSSMTDLMIIWGDDTRITVEAKYTEYVKEAEYSPLLKDWYEKDYPGGAPHRKPIIQCWIDYIHKSGRCKISKADELLEMDFPYQFLHRTASACFDCAHPILLYQLFYDNKDIAKMKEFEKVLQECASKLKLDPEKLPFYIVENEVINYPKNWKGDASGIFNEMKQKSQYQISDSIVVLDGYTLK